MFHFFTYQVGILWSFWMSASLQYPGILLFLINAFYPIWERIFIGHKPVFKLISLPYIWWSQLFWSYAIHLLLKWYADFYFTTKKKWEISGHVFSTLNYIHVYFLVPFEGVISHITLLMWLWAGFNSVPASRLLYCF